MSFKEWQEVTLADISIGNKGNYGIAASAVDYSDDLLTYLRITDISDDGVLNKDGLMSVDDKNAEKYILEPNDIVFARTGNSTGRSYFYDGRDGKLVYAGFLIKFSLDPKKLNPKFMRYYTISSVYKNWVASFSTGSTRGNINAQTYSNMKINLPPRNQQDFLVNILSKLDEKIEVNNQINKTLENMAQAIFKQWFVDFEFPNEDGEPYKSSGGEMVESELGMIPKGWEVMDLSEISTNIITGKTPSTKVKENYGNEIPFVKIPDMHGNVYITKTESYLSKKGVHKNKIIPRNAIIVSCIATPGLVSIASEDCQTNQQINSLLLKDEKMCYFAYFKLIELADYIRTLGSTGSATLNLNKNEFSKIKIVVPEKRLIEKYYQSVKFSFEMILENMKSNEVLRNLRDTLLPKLMSGEIRVPLKEEGEVS